MLKLIVKCWANRCVLRARRKAGWKSMVRMVAGKLFHMPGPATKKARLPNCVLLRLTATARVVEERSWRTFEAAKANTTRSARYNGHRRWKVWCMIIGILKVTRYLTGSQCSFWSAVVMCDLRSSPSPSRAAAFCACWSGANVDAGRPARTALRQSFTYLLTYTLVYLKSAHSTRHICVTTGNGRENGVRISSSLPLRWLLLFDRQLQL